MKPLKSHRNFDGLVQFWEHESRETKTQMKFATFVPDGKVRGCVFFLAGLESNEQNFITKAGAQRRAAEKGLMLVCPDTSPRGLNLPGEHDSWDFGSGASFYVDALTPGYRDHYRMYSYVSSELYDLVRSKFDVGAGVSIMGHSMGGHGALVIGLRESAKFASVSAFAPIVNPTRSPWGEKAFTGYLGDSRDSWKSYDACELVAAGTKHPRAILVDQGREDTFLEKQLLTDNFIEACRKAGQELKATFRKDYDHSYYFISSFVDGHIDFHAEAFAGR